MAAREYITYDQCFGVDWDDLLAFQTVKVTRIRDRLLGVTFKVFQLSIFLGVVVFQILYSGNHFKKEIPHSIQRVTLQPPVSKATGGYCNPSDLECNLNYTSVSNLEYCDQYDGEKAELSRRPCEYFDDKEAMVGVQDGMLLTSFTKTYMEKPGCPNAAKEGKPCDKKWVFADAGGAAQQGTGPAQPITRSFVADLERFTLLIDHSVRSESGEIAYDDGQMQGFYNDCETEQRQGESGYSDRVTTGCTKKPMICVHSHCKEWGLVTEEMSLRQESTARSARSSATAFVRGARANLADADEAEDEQAKEFALLQARYTASRSVGARPTVINTKLGDVISVGALLKLAGLALDQPPTISKSGGSKNKTIRSQGTAIVINIKYMNHKHWALFTPRGPPEYELSVSSRPVAKFKFSTIKELENGRRLKTDRYGVYFVFMITGELCVFTFTGLLLILTTSLGMLAAATFLTEFLAFYILPRKDEYKTLKFKESRDFNPAGEGSGLPKPGDA